MTLSAPPCPHLAAIGGGFGPHYGWGSAGQPDIQATWRCGCRAQNGLRRLQTVRADAHYTRTEAARRTAHMRGPPVHQGTRAHPRFISQAMRITPVVRLRVMQSRLRRPLVVDAAWSR